MNHSNHARMPRLVRLAATFALTGGALIFGGHATASPGAHGPNGEHLDGPTAVSSAGSASPRLEAHSELFEIVGRLDAGELSLFIGRYDSNEPVLGAKVEVELGGLKSTALFHADAGDYAVSDKAMLAALARPGRHALLFTVTAGTDTDLLDGMLPVAKGATASAPAASPTTATLPSRAAWWVLGALSAAALAYALRRRRSPAGLAAPTTGAAR